MEHERLVDRAHRVESEASTLVLVAGASSPLWGPPVAAALRWPPHLTIGVSLGPAVSLLFGGLLHDLLKTRTRLSMRRVTLLETTASSLVFAGVFVLPLVRHYVPSRRRRPGRVSRILRMR